MLNSWALARSVAAHGLPGARAFVVSAPLSDPAFEDLLTLLQHQRLVGLAQAAVESGALPTTDSQASRILDVHAGWCASVLRLEAVLLEVAQLLESAGIPFVVLKGAAVAHLAYPEPSMRMYGDNDILLPADTFDDALSALAAAGYVRPAAPPRPGFERRFGKGVTLRRPGSDELDLHRSLLFGTFSFLIDHDELFASAAPFQLGGRELRGLGDETRLLHACYHAALGDPDPRFSSVRDVAQMLTTGRHDPDRVLDLVAAWNAEPVVGRALALCSFFLGVAIEGPIVDRLAGYRPRRRDRRAIASYVGDNRHYASKVLASVSYLGTIEQKVAFLRASAIPSDALAGGGGVVARFALVGRGLRSLFPGTRR